MPTRLIKYRVFIASPGGLEEARKVFRKTLYEYNQTEAMLAEAMFEPVGWEQTIGGVGRAQARINEDLKTCDFAVFLFRDRWGSPPSADSKYSSGCEEEWELANQLVRGGKMRGVQLFFLPVPPAATDCDQLDRVRRFRRRIEETRSHLFKEFRDDSEFPTTLRQMLGEWLRAHRKEHGETQSGTAAGETPAKVESLEPAVPRRHADSSPGGLPERLLELAFDMGDKHGWAAALELIDQLLSTSLEGTTRAQALLARAYALAGIHEVGRALKALDTLIAEFGEATDPTLRAQVAEAMQTKAWHLGELGRSAKEIEAYAQLFTHFAHAHEPAVLEHVAIGMFNKGMRFGLRNRHPAAIEAYDELIRRFGEATDPKLLAPVAVGLLNKGVELEKMGHPDQALGVYDDLVRRFGRFSNTDMRVRVAKALCYKGHTLGELGREREELGVYDDIISRFGKAAEVKLREHVAVALVSKGIALGKLEKNREAILAYEDAIGRCGSAPESALQEQVARALRGKGEALVREGRIPAAVAVYDELVDRFNGASELVLRIAVAETLLKKAEAHRRVRNGTRAEIEIYDDLLNRFGSATEPQLREPVARALYNKGCTLGKGRRHTEALAVFDEVVSRFGSAQEPSLRLLAANALCQKASVSKNILHDDDAAMSAWQECLERFGDDEDVNVRQFIAASMLAMAEAFGAEGAFKRQLVACDDLVRRFGDDTDPILKQRVLDALLQKANLFMEQKRFRKADDVHDEIMSRAGDDEWKRLTPLLNELLAEDQQTPAKTSPAKRASTPRSPRRQRSPAK